MELPLVTVFVITYNSAPFIVETLESVKQQTYPNIELVISDDCSKDDTVSICKRWLIENSHFFKKTVLVTSPLNTGIAPNCNRAIKASSGEWIKGLAGDDKFLPETIEEYVKYIYQNNNSNIVFAKLKFFGKNIDLVNKIKKHYETNYYVKIQQDQKSQYIENLKNLFLPGPGLFFSRQLYDEIGGYDENYPMYEEYPFTSYLLERGHHIKFLDKELYAYNVREESLARGTNYLLSKDKIKFFYDYNGPILKKEGLNKYYKLKKSQIDKENINTESSFLKKIKIYFSYYSYFSRLKKVLPAILKRIYKNV